MSALDLYKTHQPRLDRARDACRTRAAFSAFADQPALYPDYADARAAGEVAFKGRIGQDYATAQPGGLDWVGEEVSPYTLDPLGITYSRCDLDALFVAAISGIATWSAARDL